MLLTSLIIFALYVLLIVLFAVYMDRVPEADTTDGIPSTEFTLLIPFRNEQEVLPRLLTSLSQLDYPPEKIEVILIDDGSTDHSRRVIEEFAGDMPRMSVEVISNVTDGLSPKKDAIELGIAKANSPWLLTTDADCTVPPGWLRALDACIRRLNPVMIAAPVTVEAGSSFLDRFQLLDFMSLQGATMGSFGMAHLKWVRPFLCNGANLAYRKDAFREVKGFEGNRSWASGDDVFLLEKMARIFPSQVVFLRSENAIVSTTTAKSLSSLLNQRIRWASKASAYKHFFGKLTGLVVFAANACILMLVIASALGSVSWGFTGLLFLVKFNVDFFLIYRTAVFFKQIEGLKSYLASSVAYPIFSTMVVILSLAGSYSWKDRSHSRAS